MTSGVRLGVIGIVFFALLGLLTLRLWTMQVTEVHAYEEKALRDRERVERFTSALAALAGKAVEAAVAALVVSAAGR